MITAVFFTYMEFDPLGKRNPNKDLSQSPFLSGEP